MVNKKDHQGIIIFCFILVIAAFIRLWPILHGSFAFTYDVGRDLLAVRDLVHFHKFSLIGQTSGQGGLFYGPWWYWILTIPFIIVRGNPVGIASFIALTGIAAVIISYWWGSSVENKFFGLFLAGTIGLSSALVSSTSQIWNPNLLILLTLISVIMLEKFTKLSRRMIFVFGFVVMMLFEMELVFGAFFLAGLIISLLLWQRKTLFTRNFLYFFAGMIVVELPRLIFELRHGFLETKVVMQMLLVQKNIIIDRMLRLKIFWEFWQGILPNLPQIVILVLSGVGVFFYIYNIKEERDSEKKKFQLEIATIILIFLVATIFYQQDFWNYYLTGLPILFAIGLSFSFSYFGKVFSSSITFLILFIYLFLLSNPPGVISSIKNPNFLGNAAVYRNQLAAVDRVYQLASGENFNYIAYTPPLIEYTWRYLFWWYGRKKYGYEPKIARQQKFFVIIEPDPGYEGRITMWLRIRENDGKIDKEYILPSGIMVQSRLRPKI